MMNHKYSIENAMEKVDEKSYFLYELVELEIFQIRQETKKFVPIHLWIRPPRHALVMPWGTYWVSLVRLPHHGSDFKEIRCIFCEIKILN